MTYTKGGSMFISHIPGKKEKIYISHKSREREEEIRFSLYLLYLMLQAL